MNKKLFFPIFIFISVLLGACSEADIEGIILEVHEEKILLSEEMTPVAYEKIKDLESDGLMEENIPLISLTYTGSETFQKGDYVKVWIDGDILMSYPGQASTKKIQIINE